MNTQFIKIIRGKIEQIKSDERYGYPPANVVENAPLALIQVDMKARVNILQWVLENATPPPSPSIDAHALLADLKSAWRSYEDGELEDGDNKLENTIKELAIFCKNNPVRKMN